MTHALQIYSKEYKIYIYIYKRTSGDVGEVGKTHTAEEMYASGLAGG